MVPLPIDDIGIIERVNHGHPTLVHQRFRPKRPLRHKLAPPILTFPPKLSIALRLMAGTESGMHTTAGIPQNVGHV